MCKPKSLWDCLGAHGKRDVEWVGPSRKGDRGDQTAPGHDIGCRANPTLTCSRGRLGVVFVPLGFSSSGVRWTNLI
ncbi:hypothetical protein IF1G_09808 [Cordyceps javanica]|uniref:Uncharacterized protein n=1 Tax=Cordyceps javanica TaxID=43265 RepID=A0A545UQJ8_9HYPO|nr:hypothetical protein IF1G_09808 [Cordyceps javanica]